MNLFDRNRLELKPLSRRQHDLGLAVFKALIPVDDEHEIEPFKVVAEKIIEAKEAGASVILMMGGHVLRSGTQRYIIDLMEKGFISCIAMNGSGVIHDFEFALIGETTESVARYIKEGQFGLWNETGHINEIINNAYKENLGMGEAVGKAILEGDYPHKEMSLLVAGYRLGLPVTVHVGIGHDIIHEHPNCSGAATGETSYRDFLAFAKVVENLERGVIMNFGSAVMAPEGYLKALSMARNVAYQEGRVINKFSTLVCDLCELPDDFTKEPDRKSHAYYFRPWKTMLVRTVADGGESFYVRGDHARTIPSLWTAINEAGS